MTKRISLTKGLHAIVSDADFALVSQYKWRALQDKSTFYALANVVIDGKHTTMRMHRLITGAQRGDVVDHQDGNGLNNCRSNLRVCSHNENNRNRAMRKKSTSKFKGVHRPLDRDKWTASIKVDGRTKYLGSFDREIDAAKAYDTAARSYYGRFAKTNF